MHSATFTANSDCAESIGNSRCEQVSIYFDFERFNEKVAIRIFSLLEIIQEWKFFRNTKLIHFISTRVSITSFSHQVIVFIR